MITHHILSVGKLRQPAYVNLFELYTGRCRWTIRTQEVPVRKQQDKSVETRKLVSLIPAKSKVIALDEHGHQPSSRKLADRVSDWQDDGTRDIAWLIGGADGLDFSCLTKPDFKLAFGALTWPHQLARVMLAEQIYRCECLINGHPYHRD